MSGVALPPTERDDRRSQYGQGERATGTHCNNPRPDALSRRERLGILTSSLDALSRRERLGILTSSLDALGPGLILRSDQADRI